MNTGTVILSHDAPLPPPGRDNPVPAYFDNRLFEYFEF